MRYYGYSMMENLNSTSFERLPYCSDWCLQLAHIIVIKRERFVGQNNGFVILGKSCIKRSVICTMTWQFFMGKQNRTISQSQKCSKC